MWLQTLTESKGKAAPYISNACVSTITMQITNTYLFFGRPIGEICNAELHPEYMRLSSLSRPTARRSWWCRHGCTRRSRWCNHGCVAMRAPNLSRLAVIRGLNNQRSIFFIFKTNYLYLWIPFFKKKTQHFFYSWFAVNGPNTHSEHINASQPAFSHHITKMRKYVKKLSQFSLITHQ